MAWDPQSLQQSSDSDSPLKIKNKIKKNQLEPISVITHFLPFQVSINVSVKKGNDPVLLGPFHDQCYSLDCCMKKFYAIT